MTTCPLLGYIILLKMIHAVLHHHPYLHQTTQLTMKNLSILFKDTLDAQNQLAFEKKEHLWNVAMVLCMSCKLLLHYSLMQMDIKHTILQEMIIFSIFTTLSCFEYGGLMLIANLFFVNMLSSNTSQSMHQKKSQNQRATMQFSLSLHMQHQVTVPFFSQSNNFFPK